MNNPIRIRTTARLVLALLAGLVLPGLLTAAESQTKTRPNILFLSVDDLRPELGAYGLEQIKSPNLDRLADEGLLFQRAYCSVATCGASRASLFTGVRPSPTRFVTANETYADRDTPWAPTMNTYFKEHGYRTLSLGKILHHPEDSEAGWSEKAWRSSAPGFAKEENRETQKTVSRGPSTEAADVPDEFYADGDIARRAMSELRDLATRPQEPFFLAVGFHKPHLPFVAPQKYWDLYPIETIRLPDNYRHPENVPKAALHNFGELRNYADIPPTGPLSDEQARHLIRGYYACVSYVDTQVGLILDELERLGLSDNTIVVVWGDHGWNLGDHLLWCKHSTFESSLRIPLIVRAPGFQGGKETKGITESIDIYPTLCELAGLPIPKTVEGISFVPLLKHPHRPWTKVAYSRFRTGDSIRTDRYRYSEFHHEDTRAYLGRMLYDQHDDPLENHNLSEKPEMAGIVEEHAALLRRAMSASSPY